MRFFSASVVAWANFTFSSSITASSCQPNQPLSPAALSIAIVSGFWMSPAVHAVRKAFQPPLSGGSLRARRATSVDQSICCRSTLNPAASSCCLATSGSLAMVARSVGRIRTTGVPS